MTIADLAAARIGADADTVFAFVTDPARLNLWTFGTWRTVLHPDGLVEGFAMGTGARIFVRIDADPGRRLADYHVGPAPDRLAPRIFARVIPGTVTGHGPDSALLTLGAVRAAEMDEDRWKRLVRMHAVEVDLVRQLIETGHDHRLRP